MKYQFVTILFLASFSCLGQGEEPPLPPPPPPPPSEMFIGIKEEMPRFPGCENQNLEKKELKECAQGKMLAYIYENLVYPSTAKQNRIEGMCVVQFKVEKNGTLGDIRVVRDLGSGTGQAAAAVIHKMNEEGIVWIPGKQRERTVVVQYTLPIKFSVPE